ncbi:hypothetical protein MLD38_038982 [Melastoma candidum]|uniref:Uncharacterized protein n=1 Tax=Melastoma candidum TaxID=119954 RepID=A0ACB9L1V5_9MYRT|nr:hypothetical protein MLD38_038982 [Melastoma candidum]
MTKTTTTPETATSSPAILQVHSSDQISYSSALLHSLLSSIQSSCHFLSIANPSIRPLQSSLVSSQASCHHLPAAISVRPGFFSLSPQLLSGPPESLRFWFLQAVVIKGLIFIHRLWCWGAMVCGFCNLQSCCIQGHRGVVFYANWDEVFLVGATAVVSTIGGFGSEEQMRRINKAANTAAVKAAKECGLSWSSRCLITIHHRLLFLLDILLGKVKLNTKSFPATKTQGSFRDLVNGE